MACGRASITTKIRGAAPEAIASSPAEAVSGFGREESYAAVCATEKARKASSTLTTTATTTAATTPTPTGCSEARPETTSLTAGGGGEV